MINKSHVCFWILSYTNEAEEDTVQCCVYRHWYRRENSTEFACSRDQTTQLQDHIHEINNKRKYMSYRCNTQYREEDHEAC